MSQAIYINTTHLVQFADRICIYQNKHGIHIAAAEANENVVEFFIATLNGEYIFLSGNQPVEVCVGPLPIPEGDND